MAIPDNKKRVNFSLCKEDIDKLAYLYLQDKKVADGRIYESDTLSKIIDKAYQNERGNLVEKGVNK